MKKKKGLHLQIVDWVYITAVIIFLFALWIASKEHEFNPENEICDDECECDERYCRQYEYDFCKQEWFSNNTNCTPMVCRLTLPCPIDKIREQIIKSCSKANPKLTCKDNEEIQCKAMNDKYQMDYNDIENCGGYEEGKWKAVCREVKPGQR